MILVKNNKVKNVDRIGLDIGSHSIKMVQLERRRGEIFLLKWGKKDIPANVINRGIVDNPVQLGQLISCLFKNNGVENPGVVAAVPCQQVFIRHLYLPPMPDEEISEAIRYQVQSLLPIPAGEAVMDYMIPRRTRKCSEKKYIEALVVAARRPVVEALQAGIKGAGAVLQTLEIEPLALYRMSLFSLNQKSALPNRRRWLSTSLISILKKLRSSIIAEYGLDKYDFRKMNQKIFIGTDFIPQKLRKATDSRSGVLLINANQSMVKFSLFEGEILRFNRNVQLSTENVLANGITKELSAEAWRSLEYYQLEYPYSQVERILLTGDGIRKADLTVLAEQLAIPTVRLDPLMGIKVDQSVSREELEEIRLGYGVALGLAVRGTFSFV